MADRLLVLVPHEQTHAPRSILEQARNLGPDVTETRNQTHNGAHRPQLVYRKLYVEPVRPCAKLCFDFSEVAVIGLLYIRLTGIAQLDLMVGHALGGGPG